MGKDEWKFSELSHNKGFQIFYKSFVGCGQAAAWSGRWRGHLSDNNSMEDVFSMVLASSTQGGARVGIVLFSSWFTFLLYILFFFSFPCTNNIADDAENRQ